MADYQSMLDIITGTPDEKAARINDFLREIYDLLAKNENISKHVRYHIKERGENDRNRLAKIFDFQGTDQDTLTVLNENSDSWEVTPESFWSRPMPYTLAPIAPQAQIGRNLGLSAEGTARILHDLDAAKYECDQVEAVVKEMLGAGSRYKNLEKALGKGVLFVLGQDISESYWTKLLPKSGNAFNQAIHHLNDVKLPALAEEYSGLRNAIIESKLVSLTSTPFHTSLAQPPFVDNMNFSGQIWETMVPQTPYIAEDFGVEVQMPYDGRFG